MIFAVNTASAQTITLKDTTSKDFNVYAFKMSYTQKAQNFPSSVVPANFYSKNMGFFCQKELKLQGITKIPFKFRLGSLQYNDWLEKKPNSGILPIR